MQAGEVRFERPRRGLPSRSADAGALPRPARALVAGWLTALGLLLFPPLGGSASAQVVDPCNPVVNPIVCENSKPGNPQSEWDVSGGGDPNIMQMMGGYGYSSEYDMERLVRATLVSTIYGGTSEIQRGIIAKTLGL